MLAVSLPLVLLAFILYALRIAPRIAKPGRSSPWDVARHGFTLRMSTTALNSLPRVAIGRLGPAVRGLGKAFYNVGAVAGVIGSGVATAGTAWAVRAAWTAVWAEAEAHAIEQSSVVKRGIDAAAAAGVHASNVGLEPLIPGVTAPLSHLPTLLLAFVIAQLIHEWGHAVAAALDDVCPSKFAVNVHLIIPSAAISFPSAVDYLPFRSRARISTAGAWHNLLTWVVLAALAATANLWAPVDGLTIDNVALGYGLETQLKPGDVITHVDDILVAPEGMWQRVINHEEDSSSALGWCIPKGVLLAGELGPCTESHLVAFTPVNFNAEHCLQPHPILKEPAGDCNCEKTHICVKLSKEANVVRIRYWDGKASQQLLWSGDRTVLYAISFKETHRPLKSLTEWASLFNSYLTMVSLSLFLFNLLLLPHTDGIHLFAALLSAKESPNMSIPFQLLEQMTDDDESQDGPTPGSRLWDQPRPEDPWQRRVRRIAQTVTASAVAAWAVGWVIVALLKSS